MHELTIGISGINAMDNPGPGVGVARSLKEDKALDAKIIGFAYDALEPGIYLDWLFDKTYLLPYPSNDPKAFIDRIIDIKESYGLDFIIPNLDSELPLYIKYNEYLRDQEIRLFIPNEKQYSLRGKDKLNKIAETIDIKCPENLIVHSIEEMHEAINTIGLPVMIKGTFYKAYRANTVQEAVSSFYSIAAEWGLPIIVQQVVSGVEMNVMGVGDGNGGILGQIAIKKLSITPLGKIWTGVTIWHEALLKTSQEFVKHTNWKGPFEMECIVSDQDIFLIEINPRFPAWSYFASGVGMNLPANMIRKSLNLPYTFKNEYEAGKLFIRYTYETICSMDAFQQILTKGEN